MKWGREGEGVGVVRRCLPVTSINYFFDQQSPSKSFPLRTSFSIAGTRQPVILRSAISRKQCGCKIGALCLSGAKEAAVRTATSVDEVGREGPGASQLYARGQIA